MNRTMVKPPVVLTLICLIVTAALVFTYQFTEPRIEAAKAAAADASRRQVLPEATEFIPVALTPELSAITGGVVSEISRGEADGQTVGWVFTCAAKGYGGNVVLMCGIDQDGLLTKIIIMEHSETPGLGTKVTDESYTSRFIGTTAETYDQVDGISGATYTSVALKTSIAAAFDIYEQVKEEN